MSSPHSKTVNGKPVEHCYLCGEKGEVIYKDGQDYFFGVPGKWDMRYSPGCSLYWLDPRPEETELHKLYESYYTHEAPSKKKLSGLKRLKKSIKLAILNASCGYSLKEVDPRLTTVFSFMPFLKQYALKSFGWVEGPNHIGRLLDVGCGNGELLNRMKEVGWKVTGIEFDSRSADIARENFGVEVYSEGLEKAALPAGSYDAVTMSHVIEHLTDPIAVLKECHKILCVGGQIVITTPNAKSLGHRKFKRTWRGLEFPRHIYIYSPESLQVCLEKAGFEVLSIRTLSRSARWIWFVSRKAKEGTWPVRDHYKEGGSIIRLRGRLFQIIETILINFSLVGEELLVVAKKK